MTQGRKSQRYLSGRSKFVGFSGLSTDRHLYVEPGQVEPNLGFPGEKSLPASGTYYKLITVPNGNTYDRYWQEDTPATLVNGITIFDEGTLIGTANTGTKYTPSFATYTGVDGVLTLTLGANHGLVAGSNTVTIANDSIIFTCTQDGNSTEHGYPRATDPYAGTNIAIASTTETTISVSVGISSSGGLVAPLQMEFIASILENSTA